MRTTPSLTVGSFSADGEGAAWASRCPGIGAMLRHSALDAYLLQELSTAQVGELHQYVSNAYDVVHYSHPTSPGGVAVLLRRERLALVHKACLPFWAKAGLPQCYMCAAVTFVRDRVTGERLVIASTHHHARNFQPEKELVDYLSRVRRGVEPSLLAQCPEFCGTEAAIWGGPAPRPLPGGQLSAMPKGFLTASAEAGGAGRSGRKAVFVFASEAGGTAVARTAATRGFCAAAARPLPATGLPPSSLLADAVAVQLPLPEAEAPAAAAAAEVPAAATAAVAARGSARSFERSPLFLPLSDAPPVSAPQHPPRAASLFTVLPRVGA